MVWLANGITQMSHSRLILDPSLSCLPYIISLVESLQTSPRGDLTDCGGVEPMVILVGRDRGAGAVLNNLLMCIGNNQGIGSRMSSGP